MFSVVTRKAWFIKRGLRLDNMFWDFQRFGFHWNRQTFKLSVVGLTQTLSTFSISYICPLRTSAKALEGLLKYSS